MCLSLATGVCAEVSPPPVEVMIVSAFHMSNPGHDMHNTRVDGVLTPKRQAEIARLRSPA